MAENKFEFLNEKGSVVSAKVVVSIYAKNHSICIEIINDNKPVKLTKNIDKNTIMYGNYVDINTNPNVAVALLMNEMGYFLPNVTKEKKGVKYPFFIFNKEKLMQLDPHGLAKYEEIVERDNIISMELANKTVDTVPLDEIIIFGKPAMLVSGNIDKNTLPDGFYVYDIRRADSCEDKVPHFEFKVTENKYASVIMYDKVDIPESGFLSIKEDDLSFKDNGCATLKEFCEKHGFDAQDTERVVKRGKTK